MWSIVARITWTEDGWDTGRDLPTFYLHENVQGILEKAHAVRVAREVVDPLGAVEKLENGELHITAVRVGDDIR